jgi:hypothetical protein
VFFNGIKIMAFYFINLLLIATGSEMAGSGLCVVNAEGIWPADEGRLLGLC